MKIWGNTLVKNEERYLWFSVTSAVNYLDKLLIWDTGSTDQTVRIIHELQKTYPQKIEFKEVGSVDPESFTRVRNEMLNQTKSDWVLTLDGDEVWWDEKLKLNIDLIRREGKILESIVTYYKNIVGDIFHYQEPTLGKYSIDENVGFLTIRLFNKNIDGLSYFRPHGQLGLVDKRSVLLQNRPALKRKHTGLGFLHFSNVIRSTERSSDLKVPKRNIKYKKDLGKDLPLDFFYPEVFFRKRPEFILSPWVRRDRKYYFQSAFEKPLKVIKRRLFPATKSGY